MTFSVYQSFRTVPVELIEAARMYPPVDLAAVLAARGAACDAGPRLEHDDVGVGRLVLRRRLRGDHRSGQAIMLPGIGSYIAIAIAERDIAAIGYAVLVMLVVILLYDQLLFRPLLAWSRKFQGDPDADADVGLPPRQRR